MSVDGGCIGNLKKTTEDSFIATIFHGYIDREGTEIKLVLDNNNQKRVVVIAFEDWEKLIHEGKQLISLEVTKIKEEP